jgi:hypothetical protein
MDNCQFFWNNFDYLDVFDFKLDCFHAQNQFWKRIFSQVYLQFDGNELIFLLDSIVYFPIFNEFHFIFSWVRNRICTKDWILLLHQSIRNFNHLLYNDFIHVNLINIFEYSCIQHYIIMFDFQILIVSIFCNHHWHIFILFHLFGNCSNFRIFQDFSCSSNLQFWKNHHRDSKDNFFIFIFDTKTLWHEFLFSWKKFIPHYLFIFKSLGELALWIFDQ